MKTEYETAIIVDDDLENEVLDNEVTTPVILKKARRTVSVPLKKYYCEKPEIFEIQFFVNPVPALAIGGVVFTVTAT